MKPCTLDCLSCFCEDHFLIVYKSAVHMYDLYDIHMMCYYLVQAKIKTLCINYVCVCVCVCVFVYVYMCVYVNVYCVFVHVMG